MTENTKVKSKINFLSIAVFIATLIITTISVCSVIFPSLIVRVTSDIVDNTVNPLEPGIWSIPFFIVNLTILVIAIINYKKKLPGLIQRSIKFILSFEVSRKLSWIIVLALLAVCTVLNIDKLAHDEAWDDFEGVRDAADSWTLDNGNGLIFGFKYFLLHSSVMIFNNIRIIPFMSSICLLVLTYLFTVEISKKRFAGIIAMVILLQSNNFLTYDVSATYSSFWIMLYVLSLYLICKKWYFSHISFIYSVFSKGITAIFLPLTLFFIYRSEITRKKKILVTIPYAIILLAFMVGAATSKLPAEIPHISIHYYDFWNGFTSLAFQLRFDGLVLVFLLPLVVALFFVSRRGVSYVEPMLILIMGALLASPLLSGITDITLQPYRQLGLVVFFAMGSGLLFSRKSLDGSDNFPL